MLERKLSSERHEFVVVLQEKLLGSSDAGLRENCIELGSQFILELGQFDVFPTFLDKIDRVPGQLHGKADVLTVLANGERDLVIANKDRCGSRFLVDRDLTHFGRRKGLCDVLL